MGTLVDLTSQFNARVGDAFTPITIQWTEGKIAKNLDGLHPVFEAAVGQGHLENGQIQMSADAVPVRWIGDQSAVQNYGQTVLKFPPQVFPKEGLCYGHLALENDQGVRETSVDIWFKVFGGVFNMGLACNYFIIDFEEALAKAKGDVYQALDDIKQQYLLKIQSAENAIDNNIASLKKLAAAVGAIQAQIDAGNVVTLVRHEADYNELKDNQTMLKDEVRNQLSKISFHPETFPTLAAIQAQYPKGTSNICVSMDNKHGFVWNGTTWEDVGVVLGDGLSNEEQQVLHNALHGKTIVYDKAASKPPYNDLNSLEDNTIVTYTTDIAKIRHAPENLITGSTQGATVITVNYSSTNSDGAGRVQVLITNKADQFVRVNWGSPATWGEWKSSIFRNYPIIYPESADKPFDNLDTLPGNSLILYSGAIDDLPGAPDKTFLKRDNGALVLTLASHLSGYDTGTFQFMMLNNGQTFTRLKWGQDPVYGEWSHALTKYDFTGIMAYTTDIDGGRYVDLDKLPVNTTVTYSLDSVHTAKLVHYPSKHPGTVRTLSCDIGETAGMIQFLVDNKNVLYHRIGWGNNHLWSGWKAETNELEPSISLFQNIGIIGDSYASGELYVDGKYIDHYDISWGQILARKNGVKAVNFSKGGLTTRDWLTNEHGLLLLNSSDPQDLYIIALGINDYQKLGDAYLGVENDVNTQANTFYGNYGKIITAIRAKAPQAKIVLSTMSYDGQGTAHNYNEAIKTLAQHFGLPVIEQNNDALFTSDLYLNHMVGGHPTAPIYAAMANAFQRLIEESMIDNLDYFMTYKQ